jgi:cobalt-zinc-cadmium efflux system outer membrane protein
VSFRESSALWIVSGVVWSAVACGCAPRDAGFSMVQTTVRERTGHVPRYRDLEHHDDEDKDQDAETVRKVRAWLSSPLDAETSVKIAMLQNPQLQAAFTRLGVARASLVQASLPPNIQLHGALGFLEDGGSPHLELEATASLTGLLALPLRRAEANAALATAQIRAASDALDVAYRTRLAFYESQAAEQEVAIVRDVIAAATLTAELLQRLHDAGNVTDLDLAEARAFEQSAQQTLADAELVALERRAALWRWLGGPGRPSDLQFHPSLPDPTQPPAAPEQLEERALAQSLDLRRMRAEYAQLERSDSVASLTGWLPSLGVGVHAERDHGAWEIGPAASLGLPLFDRGQALSESIAASQRGLEYQQQETRLAVRAATLSLRSRLEVARARVQRYVESLLPLRQQIVRESLRQYNAMQIGVAQLLLSRSRELETKRAYVSALRGYWLLRAELDLLLAGRLMDGTQAAGHASGAIAGPSMAAGDPGGH